MLDIYCRSVTNNQTVGIPIGPDTSRLAAEVILSTVDVDLQRSIPQLTGIRYIDDYEFSFPTRSDAERALGQLQHLLNEYELALNPNKTRILELPESLDPIWTSRIRTFPFRDAGTRGQKNDITAYFDDVFELFKRHPEEGLLKYAIARLRDQEIAPANWQFFENILCHCLLIEPACLPQVCDQLLYYRSKGLITHGTLWQECLNRIVFERVPLGQASEATWAMWLLKVLNLPLSETAATAVNSSEDSAVGLMALGLASVGLADPTSLTALHRFSASHNLFENQWLLCYQGNYFGWLGGSSGRTNLRSDPALAYLESSNVSFFDINVPTPAPIRHGQFTAGAGGGGY